MIPQSIINSLEPDSLGFTALHYAAFLGWDALVIELIEAGFNVNTESSRGITPLDAARIGGHVNTIARILELGGRISTREIDWKVKLGYSDWLDIRSAREARKLARFHETVRLLKIEKKSHAPRKRLPIPMRHLSLKKVYTSDSGRIRAEYSAWREKNLEKIRTHRDILLKNIRVAYAEHLAA